MRQRVELARALIGDSDILLLDEPFSSLDYLTRIRMRNELARMLDQLPRTVILVTHDIEEAAQLADRIVVLSDRPARICSEFYVELARPRELTHPTVVTTVHEILAELGLEHEGRQTESNDQIREEIIREKVISRGQIIRKQIFSQEGDPVPPFAAALVKLFQN
jgi:ABC-type nitrate/sulfonate/bicarbonate transport system ATPase subunit